MPAQNVEVMRRLVDAYNARDVEALICCAHPDVEFHAAWAGVGPKTYHGHEGIREWHRDLEEAWEEIRYEPDAYFETGDRTLLFGMLHGRGRGSGVEVAMPGTQLLTWTDGLLTRFSAYLRREDALKELGITEHMLEPVVPYRAEP